MESLYGQQVVRRLVKHYRNDARVPYLLRSGIHTTNANVRMHALGVHSLVLKLFEKYVEVVPSLSV